VPPDKNTDPFVDVTVEQIRVLKLVPGDADPVTKRRAVLPSGDLAKERPEVQRAKPEWQLVATRTPCVSASRYL